MHGCCPDPRAKGLEKDKQGRSICDYTGTLPKNTVSNRSTRIYCLFLRGLPAALASAQRETGLDPLAVLHKIVARHRSRLKKYA